MSVDPAWSELQKVLPNGLALVGYFNLSTAPKIGDYFLAGLDLPVVNGQSKWVASFEQKSDGPSFQTYFGNIPTSAVNGV